MMNLLFALADRILESDAFFVVVMVVICIILIAIGGFVFYSILKLIEKR